METVKAIDLLKKVPAKAVDYEGLFEQQMAELEKLKFTNEIIQLFREKKEALLKYISENHQNGCIPFIPAIPVGVVRFIDQYQKIGAPFTSTGDIYGTLNGFFGNEKSAHDISDAMIQRPYFMVNLNLEDCPEKIDGCNKLSESQTAKGQNILNHAETLMLAHFASDIFSSYNQILAPGFSWDDYECAYIYKSSDFGFFCVGFKGSLTISPKEKTCLFTCTGRI